MVSNKPNSLKKSKKEDLICLGAILTDITIMAEINPYNPISANS